MIVSAGRPGLSRGQLAFLRGQRPPPARHVVIAPGPGTGPIRPAPPPTWPAWFSWPPPGPAAGAGETAWLASWRRADAAAVRAADAILDGDGLSEPRLARDVGALLPGGALLWAASSLPVRDLDRHLAPRSGLRVLANRGASGIDGLVSAAIGAALAHQAAGGGPAVALLGDLALVHDAAGLILGPDEPRPDLCLLVVNNDGGGIFSTLEQAAYPGSFERVFGTPHGTGVADLAAAAGLPYTRITSAAGLPAALGGSGLRLAEVRTDRAAGAALRAALGTAARAAIAQDDADPGVQDGVEPGRPRCWPPPRTPRRAARTR